ncbi:hypothetical protein [Ferrimonas marina]|uniref:Lipoprotein n=1 Tax=Ferrimonas marina TaxID=299255 RepID=A0A1M5UCL3_9GAMM|nr:hypothetical protein [Ferrimonas marina]SHH60697.1 hypothetical protein SAMN02745129_2503 [Ferrimonas marina]
MVKMIVVVLLLVGCAGFGATQTVRLSDLQGRYDHEVAKGLQATSAHDAAMNKSAADRDAYFKALGERYGALGVVMAPEDVPETYKDGHAQAMGPLFAFKKANAVSIAANEDFYASAACTLLLSRTGRVNGAVATAHTLSELSGALPGSMADKFFAYGHVDGLIGGARAALIARGESAEIADEMLIRNLDCETGMDSPEAEKPLAYEIEPEEDEKPGFSRPVPPSRQR